MLEFMKARAILLYKTQKNILVVCFVLVYEFIIYISFVFWTRPVFVLEKFLIWKVIDVFL